MFDISDLLHPKEIAYYVAPTQPRAENEFMASDFAMSKPAIVPARREVWYTDGATGFYALRVAESAWPGEDAGAGGAGKKGCLSVGRRIRHQGIGKVRLGMTRKALLRRLPAPRHKKKRAWRWCVRGGGQRLERLAGQVGDVPPGEGDPQCLGPEPLAPAGRAVRAHQERGHPPLHERALGLGERLQHVPPGAGERPQVVVRLLPLLGPLHLFQALVRVDRHLRLLVGKQQPVPVLLRQVPPRDVDVDAEGGDDVAEVLPLPRPRPGGDRPLPDRSESSGTIDASVASYTRPRPWQFGHAPSGVFGENDSAYRSGWPGG